MSGNCDECNGTGVVGWDRGRAIKCFKCNGTGNAAPDAADVEALAKARHEVSRRRAVPWERLEESTRESFMEDARWYVDALAARESELREALWYIKEVMSHGPYSDDFSNEAWGAAVDDAEKALSRPASDGAKRVEALERYWRAWKACVANVNGPLPGNSPEWIAINDELHAARDALYALDGDGS